jgi:mannose-6-phosphate isomerase-like protein (cupin superfamily)
MNSKGRPGIVQRLKARANYLAPDGSQIRLLSTGARGSLCHCTLPRGRTSSAVSHKRVEEIWYFLAGQGLVWRRGLCGNKPVAVRRGMSLIVPPRTAFQFRCTGSVPLRFIIATLPPWPGPHEAMPARGYWS